jgi:hypothetical protein
MSEEARRLGSIIWKLSVSCVIHFARATKGTSSALQVLAEAFRSVAINILR